MAGGGWPAIDQSCASARHGWIPATCPQAWTPGCPQRLLTNGAESAPACALGWPIRSPPLRCNTRSKGNPAPMTASTPLLVTFSIYLFVVVMIGFVAWKSTKDRSEEHTSELQSLMRISYAVFCLKKKKKQKQQTIDSSIQTL